MTDDLCEISQMKEVSSLFARVAPSRTVERKVQSSNRLALGI